MCRILGHLNGNTSPHTLRSAAAVQAHGGPDARAAAQGPGWGLAANRLAITDPSGGDQPYSLPNGGVHAVFNGELYNHNDLRASLRARGHRFADRCDGPLLPAAYAEYGTAFAEHLDGMFAVAIIDLREDPADPTLVLAVDDAGMKSLYYHWDPVRRRLHFASELPALLSLMPRHPSLWEQGLDSYLATKTPFGEQTLLDGIRVLPPGATATCNRASGLRITRRAAHQPDPAHDPAPRSPAALVREALSREVHRLSVADAPLCAITSGGLDSSLVTALAACGRGRGSADADADAGDLHSFNIAYRGEWPFDERRYAREVADRSGTVHHQVEIDPAAFPDLLPDVVWHLGQPNADPITLSSYALFEAVHRSGFKVALTGDAADEIFCGYGRVRTALAAAPGSTEWIRPYVDALSAIPAAGRARLYTADYRAYLADHGSAADTIASRLADAEAHRGRLTALTDFEADVRLPAYHLRRVDHLSMAHAVEVRLPFCQQSVSRLARSLPIADRVDEHRGKIALYAAAEGLLPRSVLDRPKQPFTLPIAAMLAPGAPLTAFAREVLSPAQLRRGGQLDPAAVDSLFTEQRERPGDRPALAIWSLLIHELWREQFAVTRRATPLSVPLDGRDGRDGHPALMEVPA